MKYNLKLISAIQCRLECEPGFVAQHTPLITCVNGQYAKGVIICITSFTSLTPIYVLPEFLPSFLCDEKQKVCD